ncbi:ATP-binding protein [Acinetobacter guillouiae]|uniref:ATP-binding protein n=1 Tax=Acinetobacter guillouiae TaxID=106649 RepID=UPI0028EDD7D0|nr:ATP-binding protein [Acinetobacter guillouiae]
MNNKQNTTFKPLKIVATADHIGSLTQASALGAISELIWNGFDASSHKVDISYTVNEIEGLETIIVQDYGDGISFEDAELYFSSIGDSWKKIKKKNYHHPLHGQNGKGRFKAFSLGSYVEWQTIYKNKNGVLNQYSIIGNDNNLQEFKATDFIIPQIKACGTRVTISNLHKKKANELLRDKFSRDITKKFAVYLADSPHLSICVNGKPINPKDFQVNKKEYDISDKFEHFTEHQFILTIVEWSIETDRKIHLCSMKGISLAEYEPKTKIKAKGFNFTAYIKSEYFEDLEKKSNIQDLIELDIDVNYILAAAVNEIQGHFRSRIAIQYQDAVKQWKEEKVYPYEDDKPLTEVQKAEKDVFDILAVNVQNFLPNFHKTEKTSKKFMFKLIAQAIAENPESIQKIMTEVLGLQKEEQDQLAKLLENTSLSSVISSATIVANRLNFLDGLADLVFDNHTKKALTERDQLHKILENEAWIFDEQFALTNTEATLEKVLKEHISRLGERSDSSDSIGAVLLPDGKQGRIDLMLSKVNQPRVGEFDYLVVELKRPSKKIDSDVLNQIEKYAIAVAEDERFLNLKVNWTFLAVSNELDSYATRKANQRDQAPGVVYQDGELNIKVIVKSWAEIINDAKAKLQFINEHLEYKVTQDSSKKYLEEMHKDFIPPKKS